MPFIWTDEGRTVSHVFKNQCQSDFYNKTVHPWQLPLSLSGVWGCAPLLAKQWQAQSVLLRYSRDVQVSKNCQSDTPRSSSSPLGKKKKGEILKSCLYCCYFVQEKSNYWMTVCFFLLSNLSPKITSQVLLQWSIRATQSILINKTEPWEWSSKFNIQRYSPMFYETNVINLWW